MTLHAISMLNPAWVPRLEADHSAKDDCNERQEVTNTNTTRMNTDPCHPRGSIRF